VARTIRLEQQDKICSMWVDLDRPGASSILLAELYPPDPIDAQNFRWYWVTASHVFVRWLGDARSVASLDHARETGLRFLAYLVDLEDLLGMREP